MQILLARVVTRTACSLRHGLASSAIPVVPLPGQALKAPKKHVYFEQEMAYSFLLAFP